MEHITLLLLISFFILCRAQGSAADGTEVMGAVGGSVTFHLHNPPGEIVAWGLYDDIIVVVNFGDPPGVTFFDSSYKQRLAFPSQGRALTISQLRMGDTGVYVARASDVKTFFTLHVFKELEVPRVSCVAQNCSAGSCLYTLSCSVPGSGFGNVSYSWSSGGLARGEGPLVLLEEFPLEKVSPLTCTAQNPVSSQSITIVLSRTLCAANSQTTANGEPQNSSWSYCQVKGLLCLLGLGSLATAVAITHVLIRRREPPSSGAPGNLGAGWDPLDLQRSHRPSPHFGHLIEP